MGIFDRLSTLFRSNINDLISRAENPEKMLNQLIVDMRSHLAKAKQQVAAAIADEKRLAGEGGGGEKGGGGWGGRAGVAGGGRRRRPGEEGALGGHTDTPNTPPPARHRGQEPGRKP